jgi:hypothetical protein
MADTVITGLGKAPKIKILGTREEISLYDFHYENFRYIEDINQGFPIVFVWG